MSKMYVILVEYCMKIDTFVCLKGKQPLQTCGKNV